MRGVFKSILTRLFNRQAALKAMNSSLSAAVRGVSAASASKPSAENSYVYTERCKRVLNYWLDTELFDLPECPLDVKKKIISQPADDFNKVWGDAAIEKITTKKLKVSDKSRLLLMFQCHRAGYLTREDEKHPNYVVPRTYLVAQAMIPQWDDEKKTLSWLRSDNNEDLILNLATMRTLYRRCRSSVPEHMSLAQWVEARVVSIETKLQDHLGGDEGVPLSTEELQSRIIEINRELAEEFWPDADARRYMLQHCQPIESGYLAEQDKPRQLSNGSVTFRWRFCYYPDENESKQLGPFFVKDLEHVISRIERDGLQGLSAPLKEYVLGQVEQVEIGDAVNQGAFFLQHTNALLHGRWPENPKYGLSLLQAFAVNVARAAEQNPIVAVNGPPGTGKTTLLKDIIADRFVARSYALSRVCEDAEWFDDSSNLEVIMQHSMLVASSNNKAVENISRELPALSQLDEAFADAVTHFRALAPSSDWGLFCAILGNSTNRNVFKATLKKVSEHIKYINDIYNLNLFYRALLNDGQENGKKTIAEFVQQWDKQGQIPALVADIKLCQAYQSYEGFFSEFTDALLMIDSGELTVDALAARWDEFKEEQWDYSLQAFEAFKRQWFGKKLYQAHIKKKLQAAKDDFVQRYAMFSSSNAQSAAYWELDEEQHLTSAAAYMPKTDESLEAAEQRLQMSAPFSSEKLNRQRSELFASALRFNEALLESSGAQFSKHWEQLNQLIDGRLETTEVLPEHQQLWALLFLFFPVVSTSLSSVESQFRLMQKTSGFGLVMIDEAGQAVNYHIVGLLQRCRQAILVGDPIQLEPVVALPSSVDRAIAHDFIDVSSKDGVSMWGDRYLVSTSSAQSLADHAGRFMAKIGDRKVGIPLLVHRRCTEPMFSIANKIAYDNKMVMASQPFSWPAIPSGWIHVEEQPDAITRPGYANTAEAVTALKVVEFLVVQHPQMVAGGVYIITPFSKMRVELQTCCKKLLQNANNHAWMQQALGKDKAHTAKPDQFFKENIGTVHTFQGKEASTVIFCTAASKARKNTGGISWVNGKPNLLNVAVTRAKHHLFVVGNRVDWAQGGLSSDLQNTGMQHFDSFESFIQQQPSDFSEHQLLQTPLVDAASKITFNLI